MRASLLAGLAVVAAVVIAVASAAGPATGLDVQAFTASSVTVKWQPAVGHGTARPQGVAVDAGAMEVIP